jgi:hypothetical protein
MTEIVLNFLKEKGVSEDLLGQITPHLGNITSIDQVKEVLSNFQGQLPEGLMDQLGGLNLPDVDLGNLANGDLADKAGDVIGGIKGMLGM